MSGTLKESLPFPKRSIDIYHAVSAGTGLYLYDAPKDTYEVGDLAPADANFGVYISGNSMEPQFHDGEIALVAKTDVVENEEIGIFYLNGEGYIKQLHQAEDQTYLVSLNKDYSPIPVKEGDTLKAFGRVIGSIDAKLLQDN